MQKEPPETLTKGFFSKRIKKQGERKEKKWKKEREEGNGHILVNALVNTEKKLPEVTYWFTDCGDDVRWWATQLGEKKGVRSAVTASAKLYGLLASLCRNRSLHTIRSVKAPRWLWSASSAHFGVATSQQQSWFGTHGSTDKLGTVCNESASSTTT